MSQVPASPEEIELKLALGAGAPTRLLALPLFAEQIPVTMVMRNRYFDTPERALEASRIALRLREFNNTIIQTVKTAGHGSGGLHRRGEWEWAREHASLDTHALKTLAQETKHEHPEVFCLGDSQVLSQLIPVYATDFTRRAWTLTKNNNVIEVGLDEGHIDVDGARTPIFELELELKQGHADALWQLADEIASQVPVRPANASKAQRAVALRERAHTVLAPLRLDTPADSFDSIIAVLDQAADGLVDTQTAITHLQQAIDALMHQLPVALHEDVHAIMDNISRAPQLDTPTWINIGVGQHCLTLLRQLHA